MPELSRGLGPARLERLERIERLQDVRGDWDRLAAGAGHVFATWEWISSWWEVMGKDRELYSFVGYDAEGTASEFHDARWGDRTTRVFAGSRADGQRAAIKAAFRSGGLRLWIMELDGRPVAADLAWPPEL